MKILITGIAGFLGKNLIRALEGHEITGLGTREESLGGIRVYSSQNPERWDFKPDLLILCHAAIADGKTPLSNRNYYDSNVALTEKLAAVFREQAIIYVSTASLYDASVPVIRENSALLPQSPYEISKLWGEHIVALRESHVIVRLSSLFGAGMKEHTVLPTYVNQALSTGKIEVWGRGKRKQNYIHVEDACAYLRLAVDHLEKTKGRKLLAVGPGDISNKQLADIVARHTGAGILFKNTDTSPSRRYQNEVTRKILGFKFTRSLEQRVQEFIEWKKKQS